MPVNLCIYPWHFILFIYLYSYLRIKTPVTLGRRSHDNLDRHQIAVQNASITVASPRNAVESPRTPRDGVCVLLQITNAVGSPSFEKRSAIAVTTQYSRQERRDIAVSPS
jgi:hypothetical protein